MFKVPDKYLFKLILLEIIIALAVAKSNIIEFY